MKNLMKKESNENNEKGHVQAKILAFIIVNIPFILFALLYKTPFTLESQLWKIVVISLLSTSITLIVNYYLVNLKSVTEMFLDPMQLAKEINKPTKMSQISMQGYKKKKNKEVVMSEGRYQKILSDKITSKLSFRNTKVWYNTSMRMLVVFSSVVLFIYVLNIQEYLLTSLILTELLFFITPILVDYFKIKSNNLEQPKK